MTPRKRSVRACSATLRDAVVINIARGESHSIRKVVTTISELAGFAGALESLPQHGDVHSTVFDTSLMRHVLGDWSFVPLAEGLRREIKYFKNIA